MAHFFICYFTCLINNFLGHHAALYRLTAHLIAFVLDRYFQLLLLLTHFNDTGLVMTPAAKPKTGNLDAPEMSTFKRLSIILCTRIAGGGVFLPR